MCAHVSPRSPGPSWARGRTIRIGAGQGRFDLSFYRLTSRVLLAIQLFLKYRPCSWFLCLDSLENGMRCCRKTKRHPECWLPMWSVCWIPEKDDTEQSVTQSQSWSWKGHPGPSSCILTWTWISSRACPTTCHIDLALEPLMKGNPLSSKAVS